MYTCVFYCQITSGRITRGIYNLGECALRKDDQEAGLYKGAINQVKDKKNKGIDNTLPQAPSPTITSFLRMSAMMRGDEFECLVFRRDKSAAVQR